MSSLSSYGSQVLNSGDILVKDVTSGTQHRIDTEFSTHLTYVIREETGQQTLQQVTTAKHSVVNNSGRFTLSCLKGEDYVENLDVHPEETTITSDETSATISSGGLSFSSDESAIYFGLNKVFRLKYFSESPERLVFQYLEPSTSEYVTKFSCAKR